MSKELSPIKLSSASGESLIGLAPKERPIAQWVGDWIQAQPRTQEALAPAYAFPLLQEVGEKSAWTYLHSVRVGLIVEGLAGILNKVTPADNQEVKTLSASDLIVLRRAAYLHDVGKLVVPTEILDKKGRPTEKEAYEIQAHPRAGLEIVSGKGDQRVGMVLVGHHEHQARPYPRNPREQTVWVHPDRRQQEPAIILMQKVIAVADVFDALSNRRPYPKWNDEGQIIKTATEPLSSKKILQELEKQFVGDLSVELFDLAIFIGNRVNNIPEIKEAQSQVEHQLLLV